ncbi:calcium-binding protein [Streptomyces sp. NBC_00247]|uniref:calcium-binding protein n=1 Tax=Streptomyces sp. NBC_00247 TaxID=2975689 RepID=UPI002E28226E|nr:calcium-binding protein [Streptomyces sp. NBC_00247]
MRVNKRAATVLALALGAAVLTAPAASADPAPSAASLVHQDGELWYEAAPGQRNALTVSSEIVDRAEFDSYHVITFQDRFDISIDTEAATWDECVHPSEADHTVVRCAVEVPLGSDDSDIYDVDLGDGADTATIDADSRAYASIHGGAGADTLTSGPRAVLFGEGGDDHLNGGGGIFGIGSWGGAGDDTLSGCSYECFGSAGDDILTGTSKENVLHGGAGNDVIRGKGGDDEMFGDAGDDTLYGQAGDDTLRGNRGDDILRGGAGTDTLVGGPGTDAVHQH